MSEQQYQGTLASGGTFIADSQGIRILDPGGNQLASFDRQVISGASRDGQTVTVERYNDTIVTLTAASITDAVGLESYVRDVMLAPAEAAPEPPSDEAPAPPVPPSAAAAAAAAAAASPPPPVPPVPPAPSPPTEPPSGETPPLAFDAIDDEGVSEATPEAPADAAPPPPSPVTPIPPIISEPEPSEGSTRPHAPSMTCLNQCQRRRHRSRRRRQRSHLNQSRPNLHRLRRPRQRQWPARKKAEVGEGSGSGDALGAVGWSYWPRSASASWLRPGHLMI